MCNVSSHIGCGIAISSNVCPLQSTNRLDIVLRYNLCHNCLLPTHQTSDCEKQLVCSVNGCGKKHTMYIHINEDKGNVVNSQTDVVQMSALSDKEVCLLSQ